MAELLLQVADVRAGALPRARPVHPVDEVEEYAAMDDGRGFDYAPRAGVLRLSQANKLQLAARLCGVSGRPACCLAGQENIHQNQFWPTTRLGHDGVPPPRQENVRIARVRAIEGRRIEKRQARAYLRQRMSRGASEGMGWPTGAAGSPWRSSSSSGER